MYIVDKKNGETYSLPAKEIKLNSITSIKSELAQKILKLLAKNPTYPKDLSKKLKVNEQKIYYHIRNLEKSGIIHKIKAETIHGALAQIYALIRPSYIIRFLDLQKTQKISATKETKESFLYPFIENGKLNSTIIVGSPDPHGPERARSRDGYYGMDLALFLGSHLNYIPSSNVKLDTEYRTEDLKNNLILIGGPIVNRVTEKFNQKLPIKFDGTSLHSTLSDKTYHSEETGIIVKAKNPFNKNKYILLVAGIRYSGTRAAILSFLKHFDKLCIPNKHNNKIYAHVVLGTDLDSDGVVDDLEILE